MSATEPNAYADYSAGDVKLVAEMGWVYDPEFSDEVDECFRQAIRITTPSGSPHICVIPETLDDMLLVEHQEVDYIALHKPYYQKSFGLTKKESAESEIAHRQQQRASEKYWDDKAAKDLEQL